MAVQLHPQNPHSLPTVIYWSPGKITPLLLHDAPHPLRYLFPCDVCTGLRSYYPSASPADEVTKHRTSTKRVSCHFVLAQLGIPHRPASGCLAWPQLGRIRLTAAGRGRRRRATSQVTNIESMHATSEATKDNTNQIVGWMGGKKTQQ